MIFHYSVLVSFVCYILNIIFIYWDLLFLPYTEMYILLNIRRPVLLFLVDKGYSNYRMQFRKMIGMKMLYFCVFYRQGGKDLTKKGPNIKLGPQGDKKGLGQDPRKDSSMESGHHLKVQIYF